jgi:hypothetical protein
MSKSYIRIIKELFTILDNYSNNLKLYFRNQHFNHFGIKPRLAERLGHRLRHSSAVLRRRPRGLHRIHRPRRIQPQSRPIQRFQSVRSSSTHLCADRVRGLHLLDRLGNDVDRAMQQAQRKRQLDSS